MTDDAGGKDLCAASRGQCWPQHELGHLKLDIGGEDRWVVGVAVLSALCRVLERRLVIL